MSTLRAALEEHVARFKGVVTRNELTELGYSTRSSESLVRRGILVPILPGVYRSRAWPPGLGQFLVALCRRYPEASLSHTTAGQQLRVRGMSDPRVHLLVPHGSSPDVDRVVVHRCRSIDDDDVVDRPNGLRITSPARTLFDASAVIGPERTESALEHVLHERLADLDTIAATFARLAVGGRPGSAELGAVLRGRPAWTRAAESGIETRVARALRAAGFPEPVRQFEFVLGDGRRIRVDFAYPQWRLIIEVDHPFTHGGRRQFELDRDRDRQLLAMGWRVVRLTEADLGHRLTTVLADLRRLAS